jgi:hypothetical protein
MFEAYALAGFSMRALALEHVSQSLQDVTAREKQNEGPVQKPSLRHLYLVVQTLQRVTPIVILVSLRTILAHYDFGEVKSQFVPGYKLISP